MSLLLRTAPIAALVTLLSVVPVPRVAAPPHTVGQVATGPVATAVADRDTDSGYSWPLQGTPPVVRDFDPPPHRYGRGHRGVDLAGEPGQPVVAAAGGTVLFAGPVGTRPVVSIQHSGGLRTTYEPVMAVVAAGDVVATGQRIGTLSPGHPGCSAVACLHWGLLRGDEYLDPLQLLAPGPLRLLPWDGGRGQPAMSSCSLLRSRSMARVCSWHTRDSVTPSTPPISASVRFSK